MKLLRTGLVNIRMKNHRKRRENREFKQLIFNLHLTSMLVRTYGKEVETLCWVV